MFCPKCGNKIGRFAKFCPECGQKLENNAENITEHADDRIYVLTIKRPIQLHAVNLDIAIMVDGEIERFIPNGGEVDIPLSVGKHSIGFIYSMVNKCVNVNIYDNVSLKVQLYPDAFKNREELVKTIGHERVHCEQVKLFGEARSIYEELYYEKGPLFSEEYWWTEYVRRTGYDERS